MQPCNGCGKCCKKYGGGGLGSATERDWKRWRERPDIKAWTRLSDLWINPLTGSDCGRCPWLKKKRGAGFYRCSIHDVRPDVCRNYPVSVDQMRSDGCEMLTQEDEGKSDRQLTRELNRLMAEQRVPPCWPEQSEIEKFMKDVQATLRARAPRRGR